MAAVAPVEVTVSFSPYWEAEAVALATVTVFRKAAVPVVAIAEAVRVSTGEPAVFEETLRISLAVAGERVVPARLQ